MTVYCGRFQICDDKGRKLTPITRAQNAHTTSANGDRHDAGHASFCNHGQPISTCEECKACQRCRGEARALCMNRAVHAPLPAAHSSRAPLCRAREGHRACAYLLAGSAQDAHRCDKPIVYGITLACHTSTPPRGMSMAQALPKTKAKSRTSSSRRGTPYSD